MERMYTGKFLTRIPAKVGQLVSCKHCVPLCRDDIMLALQIVSGENVEILEILM